MSTLDDFRHEVSQWIEINCPAEMRLPLVNEESVWGGRREKFINPAAKVWLQRVVEKGWTAPSWPTIYGGAGLSVQEAKIIEQEMTRLGCRKPIMSLGIPMMGPTIMEYGTEEQRLKFLPPIARGEIRWCQGYSEPGAGSDLASLKTRAELVGDEFVVNGQKVWTSYADKSDYLFCLVRTDFDAPKHQGISVLLIDMAWPGVTTRPIELISGSSHFCEVFLDDVRVPRSHLLGELNKGWDIAKRMLQHERSMMGEMGQGGGGFRPDLVELAQRYLGILGETRIADPVLRSAIAAYEMEREAIDLTIVRTAAETRSQGYSMAAAILKYAMSESEIRKFELVLKALGSTGLAWGGAGYSDYEQRVVREWAFSKIQSIGGGTSEIQLNIVAKRVLGLPD